MDCKSDSRITVGIVCAFSFMKKKKHRQLFDNT